jgi:hypothetical protein
VDWDYPDQAEEQEGPAPRDIKIDEAKAALLGIFNVKPEEVYYQRQVEVMMERRFFHWITAKALNELAAEGKIQSQTRAHSDIRMRFYWSVGNRYWTRKANAIEKLVLRFSDSTFTRALGQHGETMFDAALPLGGFMPGGKNVRSHKGRIWTRTEHDLDRLFLRDEVEYGVEIKNTLSYIDRDEMRVKIEMCRYLGLVPLFIVRAAPANYMNEVEKAGGFTLIFEWQLYPFGQEPFAKEVREALGLKVDSPRAIATGTVSRLARWHAKRLLEGRDLV